jgi:hypothetical protein
MQQRAEGAIQSTRPHRCAARRAEERRLEVGAPHVAAVHDTEAPVRRATCQRRIELAGARTKSGALRRQGQRSEIGVEAGSAGRHQDLGAA